MEDWREKRVEW